MPDCVKVLSLFEGCVYLISSPSPSVKIQIKVGKIVQKSGVQIPAPEGQFFLPFFFSFSDSPYKIVCVNHLLISCFTNQISIKHMFSTCFIWFLNNKTIYQKMVNIKDTQFCVKNLKMKRKKDKNILTFRSVDSNPIVLCEIRTSEYYLANFH